MSDQERLDQQDEGSPDLERAAAEGPLDSLADATPEASEEDQAESYAERQEEQEGQA